MRINEKIVYNFIKKEFPETLETFRESDNSYRINSLFGKDDKRHLYIYVVSGNFIDFKTGNKGRFEDLVKIVANIRKEKVNNIQEYIIRKYVIHGDKDEIQKKIKNFYKKPNYDNEKLSQIDFPSGIYPLDRKDIISKKFFNYLNNRGITDYMINKFRLHYSVSGQYENRVILPIFESDKLVYFTGRDITNKSNRKYLNVSTNDAKGNGIKNILLNYDFIKEQDAVVLVEGPFNCFINVPEEYVIVSVFGKVILDSQLRKLKKKKISKVILAYDNDKYFWDSTMRSLNFIKNKGKIPVEIINWDKYPKIKNKKPCDFGDLLEITDKIDIHTINSYEFIKKKFLGV